MNDTTSHLALRLIKSRAREHLLRALDAAAEPGFWGAVADQEAQAGQEAATAWSVRLRTLPDERDDEAGTALVQQGIDDVRRQFARHVEKPLGPAWLDNQLEAFKNDFNLWEPLCN
jgi:hypothetical protein